MSTYGTILGVTSVQLLFGIDMIHDVKHVEDWDIIRLCKQNIIDTNIIRENENAYIIIKW